MKYNNTFISSPDVTLDIVYTYVNTTDNNWINKVKKFKPSYGNNLNKERFNYNGEIFFSLETVQKFIPWIRKIFIVHDNQEFNLDFLNDDFKKKIKFVDHKKIIPSKYLPVFNSMLIEMFIANIKGLSDNFIYLNDDVFIGDYLTHNFFFDNNRVLKQFLKNNKDGYSLNRLNNDPHLIRLINVHNLVKKVFHKNKYYISNHGSWNLNKYACQITFKLFKNIFKKMLKSQRFRIYNKDTYEFLTLSSIIAEELKIVKTVNNQKFIYQIHEDLNNTHVRQIFKIKPKIFIINNLNERQTKEWNNLKNKYLKLFSNNKYDNIKHFNLKDTPLKNIIE
jgi:hypothetical protein